MEIAYHLSLFSGEPPMKTRAAQRLIPLLPLVAFPIAEQALASDWGLNNVWGGPKKPLIELTYGTGSAHQRVLQGTFADYNQLGLNLGYARVRSDSGVTPSLDEKSVLFEYAAGTLFGRSVPPGNLGVTMIRFGTQSRDGYAYDFGGSYLYPYHQTRFLWTKVTTDRPAGLSPADREILDRYEASFRFGASTEGGLAFGLGEVISLRVGYEASVIYPRHVFWPWLGSFGIGAVGVGAISKFGREIVDASPTLGPIIYALLRSGLAYGYYLVVRDDQYWPFRSETPMTTESLKIGVRLTF
jgi:hypothetical protein